MTWSQLFTPVTGRSQRFRKLSPDSFEKLIHRLARCCGDFTTVLLYGGTRDRNGHDIAAYKHTDTGCEWWYIQCKQHTHVSYAILRDELTKLAHHAARSATFAPHAIVLAAACDVPPRAKRQAAIYARALGLPAPSYWDRKALDKMLAAHPEIEDEFFGQQSSPLTFRTYLTHPIGWGVFIILGVTLILVLRTIFGAPFLSQTPSAAPTSTQHPIPAYVSVVTPPAQPTPTPTITLIPTSLPPEGGGTEGGTGGLALTGTPSPTAQTPLPPEGGGTEGGTGGLALAITPTAAGTPTPTPTRIATPIRPTLLEPVPGANTRITVFRWQGRLETGQSFVVHLYHPGDGQTWESQAVTGHCLEAKLPAEWFGGWRWQVRVMQGNRILTQSEEWDFWFDPFPHRSLPTPRPCGE